MGGCFVTGIIFNKKLDKLKYFLYICKIKFKMKKTIVISLFGGPCSGKSTMMAGIVAELKWNGIDCEMAPEYAKELVWDNALDTLKNQFYVAAQQYQRVKILNGKVDFIITDSPLLLSIVYDKEENLLLHSYLIDKYNSFTNVNYFIKRTGEYSPVGRVHSLQESEIIDDEIEKLLQEHNLEYKCIGSSREHAVQVTTELIKMIKDGN